MSNRDRKPGDRSLRLRWTGRPQWCHPSVTEDVLFRQLLKALGRRFGYRVLDFTIEPEAVQPRDETPRHTPSPTLRDVTEVHSQAPYRVQHTYQCGEREYSKQHATLGAALRAAVASHDGPMGKSQMLAVLDASGRAVATIDCDGKVTLNPQPQGTDHAEDAQTR